MFTSTGTVKDANGSKITVKPLVLSDYASIREESLDFYRRERIRAWTKNEDLMPEDVRREWIKEAFERAAKLEAKDLPDRTLIEYDDPTKDNPTITKATKLEYALWWIATQPDGMLFALWLAAKKTMPDITLDEVEERFMDGNSLDTEALEAAANKVGTISQSRIAGNGEAPPQAGRKRRRKRKRTGQPS